MMSYELLLLTRNIVLYVKIIFLFLNAPVPQHIPAKEMIYSS